MTRPYRPSNGTEGEYFIDHWCGNCLHDVDEKCDILTRTLIHNIGEPEYPSEWIIDDDYRNPRCTAFLAVGDDPEIAAARADTRQLWLFEGI